jgi:hypothetical protein
VFHKFVEFQNLVERPFDRKIITVQTGWGGEYQKLHGFFSKISISHHVSCSYDHQQNGSAEWKHHHIVEVGLSLLAHSSMSLKFWDDAFLAVVHLMNGTQSFSIVKLLLSAYYIRNTTISLFMSLLCLLVESLLVEQE